MSGGNMIISCNTVGKLKLLSWSYTHTHTLNSPLCPYRKSCVKMSLQIIAHSNSRTLK